MSNTPPHVLQQARQGNPEAIAALMNRHLEAKGILARVSQQGSALQVVLESGQVPNQAELVAYVSKGITGLELTAIRLLSISGKQAGAGDWAWTEDIHLGDQSPSTALDDLNSLDSIAASAADPENFDLENIDLDLDPDLAADSSDLDLNLDFEASDHDLDFDLGAALGGDSPDSEALEGELDAMAVDSLDLDLGAPQADSELDLDFDQATAALGLDFDLSETDGDFDFTPDSPDQVETPDFDLAIPEAPDSVNSADFNDALNFDLETTDGGQDWPANGDLDFDLEEPARSDQADFDFTDAANTLDFDSPSPAADESLESAIEFSLEEFSTDDLGANEAMDGLDFDPDLGLEETPSIEANLGFNLDSEEMVNALDFELDSDTSGDLNLQPHDSSTTSTAEFEQDLWGSTADSELSSASSENSDDLQERSIDDFDWTVTREEVSTDFVEAESIFLDPEPLEGADSLQQDPSLGDSARDFDAPWAVDQNIPQIDSDDLAAIDLDFTGEDDFLSPDLGLGSGFDPEITPTSTPENSLPDVMDEVLQEDFTDLVGVPDLSADPESGFTPEATSADFPFAQDGQLIAEEGAWQEDVEVVFDPDLVLEEALETSPADQFSPDFDPDLAPDLALGQDVDSTPDFLIADGADPSPQEAIHPAEIDLGEIDLDNIDTLELEGETEAFWGEVEPLSSDTDIALDPETRDSTFLLATDQSAGDDRLENLDLENLDDADHKVSFEPVDTFPGTDDFVDLEGFDNDFTLGQLDPESVAFEDEGHLNGLSEPMASQQTNGFLYDTDDVEFDVEPDATDAFINEFADDPASAVDLSQGQPISYVDPPPKTSGGGLKLMLGLGLGALVLLLAGLLLNALLGRSRAPSVPAVNAPIEVPGPGEAPAPDPVTDPATAPVSAPAETDFFREAVNAAQTAAELTQSAGTAAEWQTVADTWTEAISLMQKVPDSSPNYAVAQQKAVDYQPNLAYAQQNVQRFP